MASRLQLACRVINCSSMSSNCGLPVVFPKVPRAVLASAHIRSLHFLPFQSTFPQQNKQSGLSASEAFLSLSDWPIIMHLLAGYIQSGLAKCPLIGICKFQLVHPSSILSVQQPCEVIWLRENTWPKVIWWIWGQRKAQNPGPTSVVYSSAVFHMSFFNSLFSWLEKCEIYIKGKKKSRNLYSKLLW